MDIWSEHSHAEYKSFLSSDGSSGIAASPASPSSGTFVPLSQITDQAKQRFPCLSKEPAWPWRAAPPTAGEAHSQVSLMHVLVSSQTFLLPLCTDNSWRLKETNKKKISSLLPTFAPSQHRFRVFYNLPSLCWTTRKATADFMLSSWS